MSKNNKYLFVSVPASVTPSGHKDDAIQVLQKAANQDYATVSPLSIPEFKIGTLDALIQQSDELAKLSGMCENVVSKVADSLANIMQGDEAKIAQQKTVNDKPLDQYLRTFSWNKAKYRADRPLAELIDFLHKEAGSIDGDVRSKYNQYSNAKTNLQTLTRRQTGNLSTKSLVSVVSPELIIQDSDYLETHLVAVSKSSTKDFLRSYEMLAPMVVPRSGTFISQDDEFSLYAVTTFKKHGQEFVHKCREKRWIPREFKYKEGGRAEEEKEVDRVAAEEKKLWGEALRLGRTGWSEAVMAWVHVLVLRVFVETVLRYGLPLDFVCGTVTTTGKLERKARAGLDAEFSYLAGNAFGRDKKGRPTRDDSAMSADMQAAGQMGDGGEYSAYVCFDLEVE